VRISRTAAGYKERNHVTVWLKLPRVKSVKPFPVQALCIV